MIHESITNRAAYLTRQRCAETVKVILNIVPLFPSSAPSTMLSPLTEIITPMNCDEEGSMCYLFYIAATLLLLLYSPSHGLLLAAF